MNINSSKSGSNNYNHHHLHGRGSATPPPLGLVSSGDSVHSHHSAGSYGAIGGGLTGAGGGGNSSVAGNSVDSAPASLSRPPGLAHINIPHVTMTTPPTTSGNNHKVHHHPSGHTKNASTSSSTAQTATLTPTSSLDGGVSAADVYGMNTSRQSVVHSPVNSSVSATDHLPGIAGFGSFDTDDDRSHDGLLGLQALRERAYSSPGPVLSSSPISAYSTSPRAIGVPPARPRTVSKDNGRGVSMGSGSSRPPLAGGSALSPSTIGDFGGASSNASLNRSRDASPPPSAGIISRPPDQPTFSPYSGDGGFDSTLRRALSDAGSTDYNRGSNIGSDGFISDNKFNPNAIPFSSLHHSRSVSGVVGGGPSLPTGLQRGPEAYHLRHQRSLSQPGPRVPTSDYYGNIPLHGDFGGSTVNPRRGNDYSSGFQPTDEYDGGIDTGFGEHGVGPNYPRSMSMQHSSNNYGDPNFHDSHHRRGSTGYYGGRKYDHQQHDRIGNVNYLRQDRMISPAHSPHHSSYGGHSRQSSDMNSSLTSSPMSLASGVSRITSSCRKRVVISFWQHHPHTNLSVWIAFLVAASLQSPPRYWCNR